MSGSFYLISGHVPIYHLILLLFIIAHADAQVKKDQEKDGAINQSQFLYCQKMIF